MDAENIAVIMTAIAAFLVAVFGAMRHSRCKHIECCGLVIDRTVENTPTNDASVV